MSKVSFSPVRAAIRAGVWAALCAAPVAAQSVSTEDTLLHRIRALDSIVAVRKHAVDSVRRSLVRAVPPLAVTHGPLSVRTTPELASRVRGAVGLTARVVDAAASSALAARIAGHSPVVMRDSTAVAFGYVPTLSIASDSVRRWYSSMRVNVAVTATEAQIADRLSMFVEQFALQGVDSSLSAWVMLGRLPLRPTSTETARDVYIELAANESAAVRRCRSGDTAACLDAVGLDSSSDSRLTRWYAPEDYRTLLHRVAPPRDDSTAVAAWLSCRDDFDQDACVVAAHALPDATVPFPLSSTARLMMLREAFELGGPGAYDRLIAPTRSVRERVEATAGKPMEVVVQRWLARVEAARPSPMKIRTGATVASLGWCGLFLAVGITRRRSCA
jgi:hypothetical protein